MTDDEWRPFDGCDIDTLLASARAATTVAKAGRQATAAESFRKLTLGNRLVLIADPAMIQLYELVERLAASDLPILICGETGASADRLRSSTTTAPNAYRTLPDSMRV